ncbi:mitochondrial 2-enoyl thioester reductase [Ascosphaera atra]|nr:mitochondrial 2-enoyl thioester reductase [Ascosphaera atra]
MFSTRVAARLPAQLRSAAPAAAQAARLSRSFPLGCVEGRRYISAFGYTQAKALMYSEYGEPKNVLKLHKHSIPAPAGTQVNVRLLTAPLNPADVNQIQGVYPAKPPMTSALGTAIPSAVGGNEGAFEVLSTGGAVKGLQKGDWVIMKKTSQGTWRTHAQFDESQLVRIDKEGLTPLQVGTVSVNPCTAYRMIKDFCEWDWLRQGEEWLIQNGANSGVGRAAIQLAKLWGIKTLNVVRERETQEATEALKNELKELGATAVVTESELNASGPFRDYVGQITRGGREPIRLALNCVGGRSATSMAKHLAHNSRFVTYGAMAKQPLPVPAGFLIFNNIHFDGFWVSRWSDQNPALKLDTVNDVLRLTREGKFKDTPSEEVPWSWNTPSENLTQAVQSTMEGGKGKKSVLVYQRDD